MRVLFISGELIAGDLAYRLKLEGCEVKLFIEHPDQQNCLDGFVEKTKDWKKELDWVGKDGLIIFDDVGYGEIQDDLRKDGYRVVGGSEGGDKLELDREFGRKIFAESGMNVVPLFNFDTPEEAAKFVRENKGSWVVKQNNHQSALNYVGQLTSGEDVLSILDLYKKVGVKNITLQKKIEGIEIGVARYFNGTDWVSPIEMNVEHKSLFNGDIGPKTGEMGTLVWYDKNENNKLFQETLAKLKPSLSAVGFRGDVDINAIVNENGVFPIEITARLGCPSTHLQGVLHNSTWRNFLEAVADGKPYSLECYEGYGIVLTLALPPFPYSGSLDAEYYSDGLEVFFREKLSEEERKRIHFEAICIEDGRYFVTKSLGYTLFVSGKGITVDEARQSAQRLAEKIVIPKIFYRTDIGEKFINHDQELLRKWGWCE